VETRTPPDDALSELLRAVNVRSTVFCVSDLGAPWGFRVADSPVAKFHLVLDGAALLTVDGEPEPVTVLPGDLVVLAHGTGHVMQDRAGSRVRGLDRILATHPVDDAARMTYGGRGPRTSLLCGGFATGLLPPDLGGLLPRSFVVDGATTAIAHWIDPMYALLRGRRADGAPGAAAVFAKIADVFLTDALRHFLAGSEGVLAQARLAADDPPIAAAVRTLRARAEEPWTVASLARHTGMSRAAFASRFREVVGEPPMAYVARLRLSRGAGLLATSRRSVAQVARTVGYANEASFAKAFKRAYGQSPGAFRTASASARAANPR
jgi:AraC-like DNA-binding protein/mannose-6-phosphate isomerase-like protein (cupin superfamily)